MVSCLPCRVREEGVHREEKEVERIMMNGESMIFFIHGALARKKSFFFCVFILSCFMSDSSTLWTIVCQAPLSMGFSRQEHWSGFPCPPPGDLSNSGINPISSLSLALASEFFATSATWESPYFAE